MTYIRCENLFYSCRVKTPRSGVIFLNCSPTSAFDMMCDVFKLQFNKCISPFDMMCDFFKLQSNKCIWHDVCCFKLQSNKCIWHDVCCFFNCSPTSALDMMCLFFFFLFFLLFFQLQASKCHRVLWYSSYFAPYTPSSSKLVVFDMCLGFLIAIQQVLLTSYVWVF